MEPIRYSILTVGWSTQALPCLLPSSEQDYLVFLDFHVRKKSYRWLFLMKEQKSLSNLHPKIWNHPFLRQYEDDFEFILLGKMYQVNLRRKLPNGIDSRMKFKGFQIFGVIFAPFSEKVTFTMKQLSLNIHNSFRIVFFSIKN